jgi:glycerol-3-phosphate acyltransferase PlsX
MGGDNAPQEIIKGSVDALRETDGLSLVLVGDKPSIESILPSKKLDFSRIEIVHKLKLLQMMTFRLKQ